MKKQINITITLEENLVKDLERESKQLNMTISELISDYMKYNNYPKHKKGENDDITRSLREY